MTRFRTHCLGVLCLLAPTLPLAGFQGTDARKAPPPVTDPQVRHFYALARAALAKGNLTAARRAALNAWSSAVPGPCLQGDIESLMHGYYFPEGEALRFFDWDHGRLSYVEIRNASVALVWQARLNDRVGRPLGKGALSKYYARYRVAEECGKEPAISKAFAYFEVHGSVGWTDYGQITLEGKPIRAGNLNWNLNMTHENTIAPIPGEKIPVPIE